MESSEPIIPPKARVWASFAQAPSELKQKSIAGPANIAHIIMSQT